MYKSHNKTKHKTQTQNTNHLTKQNTKQNLRSAEVAAEAPPAGTALIFGGNVTHAAHPVSAGERIVFVASFSSAEDFTAIEGEHSSSRGNSSSRSGSVHAASSSGDDGGGGQPAGATHTATTGATASYTEECTLDELCEALTGDAPELAAVEGV